MMNENDIRERMQILMPDAQINILALGNAIDMHVVSARFAGKSTQERQRPIKAMFSGDLFSGRIGTLSINTYTPDECAFGKALGETCWQAG